MKKINKMVLLVAFVMGCFMQSNAADINNGLNDAFVGSSKPAITGAAVDNHLRILEFVLGTRMTVAQKQIFFKAIEEESKNFDEDQTNDFLSSVGLADSLNQLSEQDAEPIRVMLEKDFDATASATEDDLATIQYKTLKNNVNDVVIDNGKIKVTRQSVEAFAEYLAFLADTNNPVWPDGLSIDATAMRLRTSFDAYSDEEKEALEDFQLTWYLIRAAWQTGSAEQRAAWKNDFAKTGLKSGADATSANIKAALSTDVYADLLDFATQSGIEAVEWSSKTTAHIW